MGDNSRGVKETKPRSCGDTLPSFVGSPSASARAVFNGHPIIQYLLEHLWSLLLWITSFRACIVCVLCVFRLWPMLVFSATVTGFVLFAVCQRSLRSLCLCGAVHLTHMVYALFWVTGKGADWADAQHLEGLTRKEIAVIQVAALFESVASLCIVATIGITVQALFMHDKHNSKMNVSTNLEREGHRTNNAPQCAVNKWNGEPRAELEEVASDAYAIEPVVLTIVRVEAVTQKARPVACILSRTRPFREDMMMEKAYRCHVDPEQGVQEEIHGEAIKNTGQARSKAISVLSSESSGGGESEAQTEAGSSTHSCESEVPKKEQSQHIVRSALDARPQRYSFFGEGVLPCSNVSMWEMNEDLVVERLGPIIAESLDSWYTSHHPNQMHNRVSVKMPSQKGWSYFANVTGSTFEGTRTSSGVSGSGAFGSPFEEPVARSEEIVVAEDSDLSTGALEGGGTQKTQG